MVSNEINQLLPRAFFDTKLYNRRTFSDEQKQAYIDAVLCLQNAPSQSGYEGAITRFDDFQGAHIRLVSTIHRVVCGHYDILSLCLSHMNLCRDNFSHGIE
jgi:hypothetical protein